MSLNEIKMSPKGTSPMGQKEEKMGNKQRHDIGKIATRIMAAILAILMIVGVAGTLIYYLIAM